MLLNIFAKKTERLKTLQNSRELRRTLENQGVYMEKNFPRFFCALVPPSWIVQNVTPRELSRRSIPPISMA